MFTNKNNKPYINNLVLYEFNMDYYSKLWYPKDEKEIDEYKYIVMMNLGLDKLKVLSKKDRMVEKYMTELERVNEDPDFREYMSAEEDNLKIENSIKTQARKEGLAEGRAEGERIKNIENAKAMIKEGIDLKVVNKITEISLEELEKYKNMEA